MHPAVPAWLVVVCHCLFLACMYVGVCVYMKYTCVQSIGMRFCMFVLLLVVFIQGYSENSHGIIVLTSHNVLA